MPELRETPAKPPGRLNPRSLLLRLPIFCCVFTFLYWLIFFPLLWDAMSKLKFARLRFNLACLGAFLAWLAVMLFCMCLWFRNNKTPAPAYRDYGTTRDGVRDSNADDARSKSRADLNACRESDVKLDKKNELRASAVPREQTTPAMYNQHTGRSSVERDDAQRPLLKKKEAPFRGISLSDSERSSSKDVDGVQVRTTVETRPTAEFPKKIVLHSDTDSYFNTPTPAEEGDVFQFPQPERGGPAFVDREMERFAATMDDYTPDPDRISQHLPLFDDYLHLVTCETPLSPREAFFSDLIKQANETEGQMLKANDVKRRSLDDADVEASTASYDPRASVPLFLYSDKWKSAERRDGVGELPTPYESAEDVLTEAVATDASPRVVAASPKRLGDFDLQNVDSVITMTEMMISNEQRHSCPTSPASRAAPREVEEVETEVKVRGKPLKQISFDEERSQVLEIVEPADGRVLMRNDSEYFIAAVARPKSVTTEVYITIDDDLQVAEKKWEVKSVGATNRKSLQSVGEEVRAEEGTGEGKFVILDGKNMKAELELVLPEDDDVFVDVQSSLGKLKSKRGGK